MHAFNRPENRSWLMRQSVWWWLAVWLIFGQATICLAGDTSDIPRISVQQTRKMLKNPDTVVIDVRTYRNWWRSSKKIPTAVREDPAKVDQWIPRYAKEQTLIFYCS